MTVREELRKLGLHFIVENGVADIMEIITPDQLRQLKKTLLRSGLEIMDDKRAVLVERIKNIVIEMIHYSDESAVMNFPEYLTGKIDSDYVYLSKLFSDIQGITIENFIIGHKIERIKELIIYDELSLKEIALRMHYSSVSHLSAQFRLITGVTPTYYKNLKNKRPNPDEDITGPDLIS